MLYQEFDFLDRFKAAADDGFKAVEYLFPYDYNAQDIAQRLTSNGLAQALFNAPPGDWADGERGLACLPDREDEFRQGIDRALEYAAALHCPRIHVMAGLQPQGHSRAELMALYIRRMSWAAERASKQGVDVLMEPINTRDIRDFFLNRQDEAHAVVAAVGAPNLKVQMDLYHCQIVEGDVAMKIRQYMPTGNVVHIQIAGVPERFEPNIGEINYPYLFSLIKSLGYEGYIGCEYRPKIKNTVNDTSIGLDWLRNLQL